MTATTASVSPTAIRMTDTTVSKVISGGNAEYISKDEKYGCFNYKPIPVVLKYGEGVYVTDVEGKKYIDGLAGYSAVNQGHRHPKIVKAMSEQMGKLTLTSRAYYNDQLPVFSEFMATRFEYDRVLPMNTGVEAAESAIKIMRRYAYEVLKIPENEAIIIFPIDNFWGRSIAACSASTDPTCRNNYGPFVPNFVTVPFNDVEAFKKVCEEHKGKVAGFFTEPVQGEAGVIVPDLGYLKACNAILKETGALLCCDEIQAGLFRTGKLLASDWFDVKPDLVCLGKALTGGMLAGSCVLGREDIMKVLTPGTHGSTYGGNPLACAVAVAAVKVLDDEKMGENALKQGERFRAMGNKLKGELSFISDVRGLGLFNAIEIVENHRLSAWDICMALKDEGVLAKPTHNTTVRFTPPICITDAEMDEFMSIVEKVFRNSA